MMALSATVEAHKKILFMNTPALFVLLICSSVCAANDIDQRLDALFGRHAEYRAFHHRLVEAVTKDDRLALSDMVHYPLRKNFNGLTTQYHTKADFIKNYRAIFSKTVRAAVLQQDFNEIFASDQGIMYGQGELWVAEVCSRNAPCGGCRAWRIGIFSINAP